MREKNDESEEIKAKSCNQKVVKKVLYDTHSNTDNGNKMEKKKQIKLLNHIVISSSRDL
jgi:hypothetical protein